MDAKFIGPVLVVQYIEEVWRLDLAIAKIRANSADAKKAAPSPSRQARQGAQSSAPI